MTCRMFAQCAGENSYVCINNCAIVCLKSKGNERQIKCIENNKKYYLNNTDRVVVANYHVDGGIVRTSSMIRCDYLIIVYGQSIKAIFIELKGKDVKHAYDQIFESMNLLYKYIPDYEHAKFYARIVFSRVPKDNLKPYVKKLKQLMFKLNHDSSERIKEKESKMCENARDLN